CRREVREETGLDVTSGRLACVDFRRPKPGNPGGIRFLFDCGRLSDAALKAVTLQAEEISEYRLVPLKEARALLREPRPRARRGTWRAAAGPGAWPAEATGAAVPAGTRPARRAAGRRRSR